MNSPGFQRYMRHVYLVLGMGVAAAWPDEWMMWLLGPTIVLVSLRAMWDVLHEANDR